VIPFSRKRSGLIVASFDDSEVSIVSTLAQQLTGLLAPLAGTSDDDPLPGLVIGGSPSAPTDAALLRLFPNAYAEDDEASNEFRSLTERGLASRKVANASVVLETIGTTVRLDAQQSLAWLRTLTDIRLAIAARLGIETEESVIDEADEQTAQLLDIYDWLGGMQDSLVRALER
jgi:hypothetical protein